MSDVNLLMFGCAVSMIAAAGIYVYLRERFTDDQRKLDLVKAEPEQAKESAQRPLRKAV
jgi:hypothetical protein